MKKKYTYSVTGILLATCLLISLSGFGQNSSCKTDEISRKNQHFQPKLKDAVDASLIRFTSRNRTNQRSRKEITIPVHVVVVHTPRQQVGTGDNISIEQIRNQIAVLNRDFNRFNKDSIKTPIGFSKAGMDIYFCLAQTDPFGGISEGVTRYPSSLSFTENEFAIKEATGWSRTDYLNIYVTKLEEGNFGFSYIPSTDALPDEVLDGVVVNVNKFGGNENDYSQGRTLVHEVGHFLGLKHIWGENGCDVDDGIADTPQQDTANIGCPVHPKPSCDNMGDMFMNYMDYSADSCVNAFTAEQVAYMVEVLNTSRFNLTVSNKAPECTKIPQLKILGVSRVLPKCFGFATGSLELIYQGGLAPYEFYINNVKKDTSIFTGLKGGEYVLRVLDKDGRVDSVKYVLFEPDKMVIGKPVLTYLGCAEDSSLINATFTAKGGVVNNNGYQYTLGSFPTNNTGIFTNILANTYKLKVTDSNNCMDSIAVFVKKKKFLSKIPESVTNISCFGKTDGVYKIGLSDTLKIYDYKLGNTVSPNGLFENLAAATYTLTIKDSTGCVLEKPIEILEPTKLRIDSVINTMMPCFPPDTGKIIVMASGGTFPLLYTINNNTSLNNTFQGNGAGKFTVSVKDSRGCEDKLNQTIFVGQIGGLEKNILVIDAFCQNNPSGRVIMQASGGSGNYNFYINGTLSASDVANLTPGSYVLTVEDNGSRCSQSERVTIGLQPPMEITIDTILKKSNGKLQVVFDIKGGKPPYLYSLDGGKTFKSVPIFDDVEEGNFVISVFDASNCQVQKSFLLTDTKEEKDFGINVYPNPFSEYIYLQSTETPIEDFSIEVFNLSGQKIPESKYIKYYKEKYLMQLNTEALPNSIYFIKLAYRNKTTVYKIIKI